MRIHPLQFSIYEGWQKYANLTPKQEYKYLLKRESKSVTQVGVLSVQSLQISILNNIELNAVDKMDV